MTNFDKGWRGALMGLAAYLITVLILSVVLGGMAFSSPFYFLFTFGFPVGIIFVVVGIVVAISKSPPQALRPLIITSIIVLTAVGGCFGLIGLY